MSLKQQATNSVFWSSIERFSVQGIQYVLSILIARQLLPSDYGMIAMLGIFMAVAQTFVDSGFGNALIQKKHRTETDYSTVFYFNIAVAIVLYAILYFCSPFIASFFGEPKLDMVTKVIGLTLIINSIGIVQQTKLTVALDFKRQAYASLVAVMLSGAVGIWMAYNGYGVWTLVWQALLNNVLRVALLWCFTIWKPIAVFSIESFRGLFAFGSKLLASQLLHTIYTNLYTLVIGKQFAATELGFFNRASTLAQFPSSNFTNVIVRAVYPIQCKIQDDTAQLNRTFLVYLRMACYVIFPIMIALCVMAEPLIELLLTDKWLPAVPFFQILCLAYMWDPVMKINHNMLNVKGRSDYFLRAEIIKKAVAVLILVATIPFGITVMCLGLIAYSFADMLIIIHFTHRLTQITLAQQTKALGPVILLSATMGLVIWLTMLLGTTALWQLILGSIAALIYYFGGSYILKFNELKQILSIMRNR
ncbi:MAG: lipopolysaccharide biosynthesis protein [Mucinivorans sp.]